MLGVLNRLEDEIGVEVSPFDWFLEPVAKRFLVQRTESLEVCVVDSAWDGEPEGEEDVQEGSLGFANAGSLQGLV